MKPLYINLSHLDKPLSKSFRLFTLATGGILLLISTFIFIKLFRGETDSIASAIFAVIYLLLAIHNFQVWYTGKRNILLPLKAFAQIDNTKVVYKPTYFAKTQTFNWQEVKQVDIQLFDLYVMLKDGQKIHLNLNPIEADEDIKAIKAKVQEWLQLQKPIEYAHNKKLPAA